MFASLKANETARAVWRRVLAALPFVLPALALAVVTIRAVRGKLGHAGAPLDDAYIHFQYARAIVEGHPLRFHAGEPFSSGATSLLWPALLAPFYLVGLRGDSIVWGAWILGFASLALLGRETYLVTRKLAGPPAAIGASAMVFSFGAFTWFAASGMEVVPFAWSMTYAVRLAAEHAEGSPPPAWKLVLAAWITALLRPEGAILAFFVAATLAIFARGWRARLPAIYAALAPFFTPLVLLLCTGTARSTTAIAKLMLGNPYYSGQLLTQAVKANLTLLVGTLLNGEIWSAEFIPKGTTPFAVAGLVAIAYCGWRARAGWRAAGVLLIALLIVAPCFYITFLWNRLRYLWPFAGAWLIGFACLARALGDGLAVVRPRFRAATWIACGIACGLLGSRLDWVIEDVAQSSSGIDRQQVALGKWAREKLPAAARIGVNDTGAIAYFSGRKTFDVVGLTTAGEARYWIGGAGSRLEHYEKMPRELLPTHFIVYPEWLACDAVLGTPLHEAVVVDATILGGQIMRVHEADYSLLGTGDRPWTRTAGEPIDTIDVADLESEAQHGYELLGARDGEQIARAGASPDGRAIVDGGRTRRWIERFVAKRGGKVIARVEPAGACTLHMIADGKEIGVKELSGGDWQEIVFDLPEGPAETRIEMRSEVSAMIVYHYWITPR